MRFMAEGVDGLNHDKTRKPGKQPLPPTVVQRVVDLTLGPPPGDATHWTGRMLAKAAGVRLRSVQRILEAHRLAPHPARTFKPSTAPKLAAKLKDIVGLYVDPPAHAVVLSVDEKSQIQALECAAIQKPGCASALRLLRRTPTFAKDAVRPTVRARRCGPEFASDHATSNDPRHRGGAACERPIHERTEASHPANLAARLPVFHHPGHDRGPHLAVRTLP